MSREKTFEKNAPPGLMLVPLMLFLLYGCSGQLPLSAQLDEGLVESGATAVETNSLIRISPADGRTPRATALLLHGLNTSPNALSPLAGALAERGIESFIVPLDGGSCSGRKTACAASWLAQVHKARQQLSESYPNQPQHLIGFSLGALLAVASIDEAAEQVPDSLTLLSPALSLQCYIHAVRLFTWLRVFGLALPSFAPPEQRACAYTSLAAYNALFKLYFKTRRVQNPERLDSVRTLMLVRDGDEFVNRAGLERWLVLNGLGRWRISRVANAEYSRTPRHAMFDQDSVGERGWSELVQKVVEHLMGGSGQN